jgi:hypothetical protein
MMALLYRSSPLWPRALVASRSYLVQYSLEPGVSKLLVCQLILCGLCTDHVMIVECGQSQCWIIYLFKNSSFWPWIRKNKRTSATDRLRQCFSNFVRPRPGKFFFYKTRTRYNWCQSPAVEKRRSRLSTAAILPSGNTKDIASRTPCSVGGNCCQGVRNSPEFSSWGTIN